jgi:hypothetical protein
VILFEKHDVASSADRLNCSGEARAAADRHDVEGLFRHAHGRTSRRSKQHVEFLLYRTESGDALLTTAAALSRLRSISCKGNNGRG